MATIKDLHLRSYEEQPLAWRGRFVHNWFSNFDRVGLPVTYRGRSTSILEVAYVAAKNPDVLVDDPVRGGQIPFIERVFAARTPSEAKKLGNPKYRGGIITPRPDWDQVSLAAMDFFLRQRWQPGAPDMDRLIQSPHPLVEVNNWGDTRFGVTLKDWTGHNALGMLLALRVEELAEGLVEPGAQEPDWHRRQDELVTRLNAMSHGTIVVRACEPDLAEIPANGQFSLF